MLFLQFLLELLIVKQSADLLESQFENFITKYSKSYANDSAEYGRRIGIFRNSIDEIEHLNSMRTHKDSAYFGITQYSDLTRDEFLQLIAKNKRNKKQTGKRSRVTRHREPMKIRANGLPEAFDWRERNAVSGVRNQGKCGACWAHSTVATIESMVAIATNRLTELSVQQLVDCSSSEDNRGCRGGDTCAALQWMRDRNVTLESARSYPNREQARECAARPDAIGVQIRSNFTCESFVNDESKVIRLLAKHGPLIAAVDASTWQHYLGGVIQYHCFNDLNHAVQITGYDLRGDIPFYKVRNTWDVGFGIDGYLHIAIGNNLCGIAEEISAIDVKTIPEQFY